MYCFFVGVIAIAGMIRTTASANWPWSRCGSPSSTASSSIPKSSPGCWAARSDRSARSATAQNRRHHHVRLRRRVGLLSFRRPGVSPYHWLVLGVGVVAVCVGVGLMIAAGVCAEVTRALSPNALRGADELTVIACAIAGDDAAYGELVRRRQGPHPATVPPACAATRPGGRPVAADVSAGLASHRHAEITGRIRAAGCGDWPSISGCSGSAPNARLPNRRALRRGRAAAPTLNEQLDLDSALATLPPTVRLCITLAYAERMSHREICEATQLPLGTVKSHITAALPACANCWEPTHERHLTNTRTQDEGSIRAAPALRRGAPMGRALIAGEAFVAAVFVGCKELAAPPVRQSLIVALIILIVARSVAPSRSATDPDSHGLAAGPLRKLGDGLSPSACVCAALIAWRIARRQLN